MLQREKVSPVRNRSRDRTTMDHQQGAGGSADGGATAAAPRTALPEKPTRVDDEIRRKTVDRVAYFKDVRVCAVARVSCHSACVRCVRCVCVCARCRRS